MMKYVRLFLPAVILLLAISCSKRAKTVDDDEEVASTFVGTVDVMTKGWLEIPVYEAGKENKILRRKGYTTSYNRRTKQPDWVAWRLTKQHTYGDNRRDFMEFHEDMEVSAPRATDNDYFRSGYDRGHMCPSGDNKWDAEAQEQSFLFTNVCPQNHFLNKEEWNDLEIQCRRWARRYGEVYIACGPLFEGDDIKKIGRNKVHVPTGFFKVVLAKGKRPKAIGYIFENRRGSQGRVCTVDEIEDLTGMDFFSPLDDKIEEQVEAYANIRQW